MNTATHDNYYDVDLYTNPERNAYKVMAPSFRDRFKDSFGNSLKMTWWMMAGNIFRYATNTNVPVPNIMTLYLMKKYHGENIAINGDELTLHYHTFFWSDYDGDGKYYWNQAKTFLESKNDFNVTLAQFLLEEEVFPISFRTGWHYMDNDWQHYLDDRILPYSLHNDYPAKRTYDDEPIDNIFDWSEAPSSWIPYRPSYSNYQKPGNGKGWNVRSASFYKTLVLDYLDSIFVAASQGEDQVACLWSHLPQENFLDNISNIDEIAHQMELKYPGVKFKYCTAVEAMKLWRESQDNNAPNISVIENKVGEKVSFTIKSDEQLFQSQPFVAIKNIYGEYITAECISTGENEWKTENEYLKSDLVKVGATACDSMGNQAMDFIEYLPSDIFIDNIDIEYSELLGDWSTFNTSSWGTDARVTILKENDSVAVEWQKTITQSTNYNIFVQVPSTQNPVSNFQYVVSINSVPTDTVKFNKSAEPYKWNYLTTLSCDESDIITVKYSATGKNQIGKYAVADVVKISALVREKEISISKSIIDLGEISISDTVDFPILISNYGISDLKLFGIKSLGNSLISKISFPVVIPKMSSIILDLKFAVNKIGSFTDSLEILSNDPVNGRVVIPVFAMVQNYFKTIDNEDSLNYTEFGEWHTSVAVSNGATSRYAWLNSTPLAKAEFRTELEKSGLYAIYEIVPQTVNSSDKALYQISIDNLVIDSVFIDQNNESGKWKLIGSYYLPKNASIVIRVIDTGESSAGVVLRADAIKLTLLEELTNIEENENISTKMNYKLNQNYPNPFNPETIISFQIPEIANVKIEVFNLLGEKLNTLLNRELNGGFHSVTWNGRNSEGLLTSSGIYFYRITTQNFTDTKKMIYLR
ncbi:MAG: T9SS type A sorting domain-containing protein [Melioribacteraceae bacterium]|nr:T9SS type A sorting domain-containing protein [Melioribacteraceae bacterium]